MTREKGAADVGRSSDRCVMRGQPFDSRLRVNSAAPLQEKITGKERICGLRIVARRKGAAVLRPYKKKKDMGGE